MSARIQRFAELEVDDLTSSERAVLACGCSIFVGYREDDVVETAGRACMIPHESLVARALELLSGDEPVIETVREALQAAELEIRGRT